MNFEGISGYVEIGTFQTEVAYIVLPMSNNRILNVFLIYAFEYDNALL